MALTLGSEVDSLTVRLSQDADFVSGLDSQDGNWPGGAIIRLEFSDGTTWDATLNAAAADWNVDKAAVNTLITALAGRGKVRLRYIQGSTDLTWAQGNVTVRTW